jgi:hypothetical protein
VFKGSCFASTLPRFVVVFVLEDSHSNWGEIKSQYSFWSAFLLWSGKLNTSSDIGHLYLFLWNLPIKFMCPFLLWGHWFWRDWIIWISIDSGYYFIIGWIACKDFFPFCRQTLDLLTVSFSERSFLVWCSSNSSFFFLISESLKFYLGSCCLCLHVPVYFLLFPVVFSKFQGLILRSLIYF